MTTMPMTPRRHGCDRCDGVTMNWPMDELEARAVGQLGRLREFGEQLAKITARESDSNELVEVEVDGNGALVGLWLSEGANELGATRLGEQIACTAMIAAQRALAQRAALTDQFAGEFAELLMSGQGEARDDSV